LRQQNHFLEVDNLKKYFPIKKGLFQKTVGYVYAVDGVSFFLDRGESLGLVGESGCGKSTVAKTILRLIEPTAGEIVLDGEKLRQLGKHELRSCRKKMQIIFQDPYSSLNPRRTIGQTIKEPLDIFNTYPRSSEKQDRVAHLLEKVGLKPEHYGRYPHEFSGGQRQRVCIARALALNPKLIVGDEPVSALDVSIQAQIINLMDDLQKEYGLSYLFISHDLAVVNHICSRIAVMYLGKIVELATNRKIMQVPQHPYTQALISAVLNPNPDQEQRITVLEGDVPSPIHPPSGCHFHTRCPVKEEICYKETPKLVEIGGNHLVACHLASPSPLDSQS
jgi:oligopeptide/dipeptide ABC transporter ATP-binding protein